VTLSAFRRLERLPGAVHPAVYRVVFACSCSEEHEALVTHDDLDWAPLGLRGGVFFNFMTAHRDRLEDELSDLAARHLEAGEWPWSFFCYPEERARPVFPSSFFLLAPGDGSLGLAVRCPACQRMSVNVVSHEHVDIPWHNDPAVGVVEHVFAEDIATMVTEFREELESSRFDSRRIDL
jgi:hypothetical protein